MQTFDFNAIEQPTWAIKLKDEQQTLVNLSYPTVDLVEKLDSLTPTLQKAAKTKDGNTIRSVFSFVAELMNCNDDGFTFTAEELRDRYHLTLLDVAHFVSGYLDFIKEATDAKN